jgi:hypothetical protein
VLERLSVRAHALSVDHTALSDTPPEPLWVAIEIIEGSLGAAGDGR